jgi:hypothetical protein
MATYRFANNSFNPFARYSNKPLLTKPALENDFFA